MRRVPVQGEGVWHLHADHPAREKGDKPPGTITWEEHVAAWNGYSSVYGKGQSAERMAQRGGFSYNELTHFLGYEPKTWEKNPGVAFARMPGGWDRPHVQ